MVILKKGNVLKASLERVSSKFSRANKKVSKRCLDYRVKGSTLMETLVATVLIIVVFMLASAIMNNLFSGMVKSNHKAIDTYISEIKYLYVNDQLQLPYKTDYKDWSIEVFNTNTVGDAYIVVEAFNTKTRKTITTAVFETKQ